MKKLLAVLLVALISVTMLFAAEDHLSVPLDSDAYRIISVAELRGIIPTQPSVKPYTLGRIRELLFVIQSSSKVTEGEKAAIDSLLMELDKSYCGSPATSFGDVFQKGYVDVASNDVFSTYAGAKVTTSLAMSDKKAKDMRFKATAYVRGDLAGFASFNMDIGMIFDKLDHRAFLATDFTSDCEGVYMDLMHGGGGVYKSPFPIIAEGFSMT
ncbi:MAG: hypothetical protein KBS81_08440, partial [Spirochaetales bacterium]|nr:hypothetical protein [Candidatus Physcosoma equi]